MKHQAKKLQEIANKRFDKTNSNIKFICISSGKGGVGKSTITANLGYYLSTRNFKTVVLDADIGLANLDIIFNKRFDKNILSLLKGEASLSNIITPIEKNLDLIPGDNGEEILKYSDEFIADRFLSEVAMLNEYDFMIIDTGAGIGQYVKPFLISCDIPIIVLTPEPSSITDAYAMIKSIANEHKEIFLLINKVESQSEANNIFNNILKVATNHIPHLEKISLIGHIRDDDKIYKSIRERALFAKNHPKSQGSVDLFLVGKALLKTMEQNLIDNDRDRVHNFFSNVASRLKI